MTALHGKNTGVAIAGYDISTWLHTVSASSTADHAETTAFQSPGGAKTFIAGQRDGTAAFVGRFTNDTVNGTLLNVRTVARSIMDSETDAPVTLGVEGGFLLGRQVTMGNALQTKITTTVPITDVISVSGDLQADGGWQGGVCLTTLAPLTVSTLYASVDNGAATLLAGAANLHLVANTSTGTAIVKVQHSTDNATWVDLITFSTVALGTIAGQRIVLADGTTINRYARASVTLAGTGSVSIRVALSRGK